MPEQPRHARPGPPPEFRLHERAGAGSASGPDAAELAELKHLLHGAELEALARRAVRAEEVSRVLPQAIELRGAKDVMLGGALAPSIEDGLERSIKRNPQRVVDVIFPVIGPAIRRSVREALAHTLQAVNALVENGFSIRAWRWRLEAKRKGLPFSEIALRHTLVYRVEQVLLVHAESGLLLSHVTDAGVPHEDEAQVSGMLTAIQDFVRDSFPSTDGETLDAVEIGEHVVWIQRGPHANLALVVRGTPPRALRTDMSATLEAVHGSHGDALHAFQGDTRPFQGLGPLLEGCLKRETWAGAKRKVPVAGVAVLLLVLGLLTALWLDARAEARRFDGFLGRVRSEPGLLLLGVGEEDGQRVVRGLQDPLARSPETLRDEAGLARGDVRLAFEPFETAHPTLLLLRAQRRLEPPGGVELRFADGVLSIVGAAPRDWCRRARMQALSLTGVTRVDDSGLVAVDAQEHALAEARRWLAPPEGVTLTLANGRLALAGRAPHAWIALAQRLAPRIEGVHVLDLTALEDEDELTLARAQRAIERTALYFDEERATLSEGQERSVAALLDAGVELSLASHALGRRATIVVVGHPDLRARGGDAETLRLERTRAVADLFEGAGVPAVAQAAQAEAAAGGDQDGASRRVTFRVVVHGAGRKVEGR